ncbi:GntR family transcriptional regulator [Amycolatopsis taiwanensis]|uniref:HTH gntR-type domain-containing protein n=1 Tax=Amycolatopsis taiwanensis TaxID=342230 RepID=A0A9W6VCX0_9PSEU|nr:hypothetical protein Atai01_08090 [Amycolatopsis taiwanensis]
MPQAPVTIDVQGNARTAPNREPETPYQKIAADLRGAILCGALRVGDKLPPVVEIANRYNVALGTAHRAIAELREAGLITASRGPRSVVGNPSKPCLPGADPGKTLHAI